VLSCSSNPEGYASGCDCKDPHFGGGLFFVQIQLQLALLYVRQWRIMKTWKTYLRAIMQFPKETMEAQVTNS